MTEKPARGDRMPYIAPRILSSTEAPEPIGPYSQGILTGDMIFCSGQIGLDPVTGLVVPGDAAREIERALLNTEAVLKAAGASLNSVVKVTLFLKDMGDFSALDT
jgi:2-iminobutanoate/2-iminopropanoate deaminase